MTTPDPARFEKLGLFYLGRQYDVAESRLLDELLLYDAKDLCTHAMCVGMTGSGKTGLCLSLLEEAALDGVPAICVDPKGDLANLMLTFPELRPDDFKPWLDAGEAKRKGVSLDQFAEDRATLWREGLKSWGQGPDRIRSLRDAADVSIYTPGASFGLPLTVLKSFDAPPQEFLDDREAIGERATGSVSALLALMDMDADPLTSPEHILISSVLSHQWQNGKDVAIGDLIRLIQTPPLGRIGVVDLDSFMSPADRTKLAMRLNNLLASPAFASWLEGDAMSIESLLYTREGRPRLSILSIAHLDDNERMFFVTILLNELVAWMRRQTGTSTLRAMLYMDEVAGYFPPVSNPPSKPPMMTLLKQARAFGLGVTLATQNPVDLDYKGLSNIGTWFLGRLQTERDKARVLEGLEGVSADAGTGFDRKTLDRMLSTLGKRVFLMNNVHDQGPSTFQTRWAMSYLAGPLARDQIRDLMEHRRSAEAAAKSDTPTQSVKADVGGKRPAIPAGIEELFLEPNATPPEDGRLIYRPGLLGKASLHFVRASADLDRWVDVSSLAPCFEEVPEDTWRDSGELSSDVRFRSEPDEDFAFDSLPDEMMGKGRYRSFRARYKDYVYRHHSATLYQSPGLDGYAPGGSDEGAARVHFRQLMREKRDLEREKLRERYAKRIETIDKKIRTAEDRVGRESSQYDNAKWSSVGSILSSLLGGRTRVSTAVRGFGRAAQQRDDVTRARRALDDLQDDREELEQEAEREIEQLAEEFDLEKIELETTEIPPRKSDIKAEEVAIVWTPWTIDASGIATPLFDLPKQDD